MTLADKMKRTALLFLAIALPHFAVGCLLAAIRIQPEVLRLLFWFPLAAIVHVAAPWLLAGNSVLFATALLLVIKTGKYRPAALAVMSLGALIILLDVFCIQPMDTLEYCFWCGELDGPKYQWRLWRPFLAVDFGILLGCLGLIGYLATVILKKTANKALVDTARKLADSQR